MSDLQSWIGRSDERRDTIRPWPAQAFHMTLDRPGDPPQQGDPLPPFWRWLYFLEARRRGDLGGDGHPEKGAGMTPPVGLARRMWAGGRVQFHKPLKIGATATRLSTIQSIIPKTGRSGPLCFVTIRHEVLTAEGAIETEEQDIVYRSEHDPQAPPQQPPVARRDELWRRPWTVDSTMLFRYSALTFNGHRIHYDRDYARRIEGYDGLVIHAPLLATLMLELVRDRGPDLRIAEFRFRATAPVLDTEAFEVCGAPTQDEDGQFGADLWVRAPELRGVGPRLAMEGAVRFA